MKEGREEGTMEGRKGMKGVIDKERKEGWTEEGRKDAR